MAWKALAALRERNECSSWHVEHPPYSPHSPRCEVGECQEHPKTSVVWADGLRPVNVAVDLLDPLPPDIHLLWVCGPCGDLVGATVKAAGYGGHIVIGGIPADRGIWGVDPVPVATIEHWLAASRRGLTTANCEKRQD